MSIIHPSIVNWLIHHFVSRSGFSGIYVQNYAEIYEKIECWDWNWLLRSRIFLLFSPEGWELSSNASYLPWLIFILSCWLSNESLRWLSVFLRTLPNVSESETSLRTGGNWPPVFLQPGFAWPPPVRMFEESFLRKIFRCDLRKAHSGGVYKNFAPKVSFSRTDIFGLVPDHLFGFSEP